MTNLKSVGSALLNEGEKMKKIVIGAALVLGVGFLNIASSADAYARRVRAVVTHDGSPSPLSSARYVACDKNLGPKYGLSPGYQFIVDDCYFGRTGY
jgi:hypothetical protein